MPGSPLAVKVSSKSGIAVRCGVRGDDAGAGLMPPFLRALEASVKSGAARCLRDHRETRDGLPHVDRYGASPLQDRPLVHPRARELCRRSSPWSALVSRTATEMADQRVLGLGRRATRMCS